MPAAAYVVPAVASVVGGYLAKRGQDNATKAGAASTDKAIAFQREQSAKGDAAYQQQMQMWQANRQALLDKYGIDIAPPSFPGPGGGAPGAVPRGPRGMPEGVMQAKGIAPGQTLGQMAQIPRQENLGDWNDWGNYGLRESGGRA